MGYTHATDIKALVLPLHLPWPRFAIGLLKVWSLALAGELSGLSTLQWSLQAGPSKRVPVPSPQDTTVSKLAERHTGPPSVHTFGSQQQQAQLHRGP